MIKGSQKRVRRVRGGILDRLSDGCRNVCWVVQAHRASLG